MDIHVLQSQPAQKVAFKDSYTVRVDLVRGGFQPRLPTSLPPPGQQQQPSPLPRRQPVPLVPPAQLHPGAPQVVAPGPAVPLQSELMDVDPSAGPPSQAVAVQPVLQPLSLGTPKESDTAAPCPAPTQQPSTQHQETLPLFGAPPVSRARLGARTALAASPPAAAVAGEQLPTRLTTKLGRAVPLCAELRAAATPRPQPGRGAVQTARGFGLQRQAPRLHSCADGPPDPRLHGGSATMVMIQECPPTYNRPLQLAAGLPELWLVQEV
ncbi:calphotin-like [Schistocerca americana]|uniref:calphotin-like n=1 Tax=Schistocerca americana TaxID=7009 RepID=UPI001F501EAB|nr:calphotin-like [Schistocerca americana]